MFCDVPTILRLQKSTCQLLCAMHTVTLHMVRLGFALCLFARNETYFTAHFWRDFFPSHNELVLMLPIDELFSGKKFLKMPMDSFSSINANELFLSAKMILEFDIINKRMPIRFASLKHMILYFFLCFSHMIDS